MHMCIYAEISCMSEMHSAGASSNVNGLIWYIYKIDADMTESIAVH